MDVVETEAPQGDGFTFHGTWREFLPIAVTNLLLTLVTLGFYRFWATARERKYLWSQTEFLDERLEWAGTGKEMFVGFLVALAVFLPLILFLQFGVQALVLRGEPWLAGVGFALAALGIFYMMGLASFRALRYRLSRTYWRGIRGGSDDAGWAFARSYIARGVVNMLTLGLMVPWNMVSLWRERWSKMSFGSASFDASGNDHVGGIMARWIAIYVTPFLLFSMITGVGFLAGIAATLGFEPSQADAMQATFAILIVVLGLFYLLLPTIILPFFAAFYRKVVGEMSLGGLSFAFNARTADWLKLIFGHIGLVIITLGLGFIFIGYRNWAFFARHMVVSGGWNSDALAQSTTPLRSDAEGLADAFDIGAI